jgi:hypothetical protein
MEIAIIVFVSIASLAILTGTVAFALMLWSEFR